MEVNFEKTMKKGDISCGHGKDTERARQALLFFPINLWVLFGFLNLAYVSL